MFREVLPKEITCPACRGRKRARTRGDVRKLGPPLFAPEELELGLLEVEELGDESPWSCPAFRGRSRAHTRDHRCWLDAQVSAAAQVSADDGGLAEALAVEATELEEDAPPEYHDVLKASGMHTVALKDVSGAVGAEREEWKLAMQKELTSLREQSVF